MLTDKLSAHSRQTDLAKHLVRSLSERGETFAAAESCTGGLVSGALTAVPGSSDVLWGGAVTYSNDAKVGLLGVDASLIASEGAVSAAVAKAMAWGMRSISGADWTVGVTGVAGPGGGSPEKPVGTVWFGWSCPDGDTEARKYLFSGSRAEIRNQAVEKALEGVLTMLSGEKLPFHA